MSLPDDQKKAAKLLASLALDYVRWTQLIPVVFGWAFAMIIILAMFLVAFQGEIDSLLTRAEPVIEYWIGPPPDSAEHDSPSETVSLTKDEIFPWIYRIWGGLAFAGWMFSIIRTKIFGPKPPVTWRRKMAVAATFSLLLILLLFIFNSILGGLSANTGGELFIAFIIFPIALFVVSAWGLSVSHFITKIQDEIEKAGKTADMTEQVRSTV